MNALAQNLDGATALQAYATPTLILVEPVAGGWCVSCRGSCEVLMFLSGGHAEAQARSLARCLALIGQDALVEIYDRQNDLAGLARYVAEPSLRIGAGGTR